MIVKEQKLDLSQFKTGLALEAEFNRIVTLARTYQMSHIMADKLLNEIYDYGLKTGKFSEAENRSYLKRKNYNKDGTVRTHLQFALNLSRGQTQEHKVFLSFINWLKKANTNIKWEFNGSDYDGYIMIISFYNRPDVEVCASEPDYKLYSGDTTFLIEAKSFLTSPTFKIANIIKYQGIANCSLIFGYLDRYYLMGPKGFVELLKIEREPNWGQDTLVMSQKNIDYFLEKKWLVEFNND